MNLKQDQAIVRTPDQSSPELRFSFIKNDTLRQNVVITFRYIIFLIALENDNELPEAINQSIRKDIIIHTASIIESCLHFALKDCIDNKRVQSLDVMPVVPKYVNRKIIHVISLTQRAIGAIEETKHENLTDKTQLQVLIRAANKANILNTAEKEAADQLRDQRNRIHLVALKEVDDQYTKSDVDQAFDKAKIVLDAIERSLCIDINHESN